MANDLNKHRCIGRLGKDVEIKYLPSGEAVANLTIACGKSWIEKGSGQKQERTTWINYVAFGKLAEIMSKYLVKGSRVYLEGELRVQTWDKDGQKQYKTEIVADEMQMLDSKQSDQPARPQVESEQQSPACQPHSQVSQQPVGTAVPRSQAKEQPKPGFDDFDDDIPF